MEDELINFISEYAPDFSYFYKYVIEQNKKAKVKKPIVDDDGNSIHQIFNPKYNTCADPFSLVNFLMAVIEEKYDYFEDSSANKDMTGEKYLIQPNKFYIQQIETNGPSVIHILISSDIEVTSLTISNDCGEQNLLTRKFSIENYNLLLQFYFKSKYLTCSSEQECQVMLELNMKIFEDLTGIYLKNADRSLFNYVGFYVRIDDIREKAMHLMLDIIIMIKNYSKFFRERKDAEIFDEFVYTMEYLYGESAKREKKLKAKISPRKKKASPKKKGWF